MFYVATQMAERMSRLLAFLDLEKYRLGAGLQQWRAKIAFVSGGVEGLGLGNGRQKMGYLPEAHTDFIFSMLGEELGLRCTLLVVLCYVVIILCGVLIAMNARDRFGMLLGFGIVVIIALQAAVNIGVNISLLPNKGLPLPFVSYGGSNLAFACWASASSSTFTGRGSPRRKSKRRRCCARAPVRNGFAHKSKR
jgi:cell division protein FtsW